MVSKPPAERDSGAPSVATEPRFEGNYDPFEQVPADGIAAALLQFERRARLTADYLAAADTQLNAARLSSRRTRLGYRLASPIRVVLRLWRSVQKRSLADNLANLARKHKPRNPTSRWFSVADNPAYRDWIRQFDTLATSTANRSCATSRLGPMLP